MAGTIDFEAEGFYDELEGEEARAERRALLDWLVGEGYELEELRLAHRRGLLLFVGAQRYVGGRPCHTLEGIARETGVDLDLLVRLRRAQGLAVPEPEAAELTEVDLEAARTTKAFADHGLSDEQLVATARVLGRSLARAAEAMRTVLLELVLEPGTSERELSERFTEAVRDVMPLTGPLVLQTLSQQLRNLVEGDAIGAAERATGTLPGGREMTIAFADLVGFTRLGEEIPAEDLGRIAEQLEALAADVIEAPVRLIKTIGDAVLFAGPSPGAVVGAALALLEASDAAGTEFPQLRVGIAHGPAVNRGGDVFGRAVNLASRVTSIARAGSALATREVRDATREDFRWSSAHARRLKGVPDPVPLYRARRLGPEDGAADRT